MAMSLNAVPGNPAPLACDLRALGERKEPKSEELCKLPGDAWTGEPALPSLPNQFQREL